MAELSGIQKQQKKLDSIWISIKHRLVNGIRDLDGRETTVPAVFHQISVSTRPDETTIKSLLKELQDGFHRLFFSLRPANKETRFYGIAILIKLSLYYHTLSQDPQEDERTRMAKIVACCADVLDMYSRQWPSIQEQYWAQLFPPFFDRERELGMQQIPHDIDYQPPDQPVSNFRKMSMLLLINKEDSASEAEAIALLFHGAADRISESP